jgi:predicted aspartyl protease
LADNSEVLLSLHEATVFWDGVEREVLVLATGRRPLLGTALLDEQELVIQFTDGGLVTIDEL